MNRSTAAELSEQAFQTAVLPVAKLVAEHITKDVFEKALGLEDVEFAFDNKAKDEVAETQLQLQMLAAGVLTVDEVRLKQGMGPMAEEKQVREPAG